MRVPAHYSYATRRTITPGLDYFKLVRRRPGESVNIARLTSGRGLELRPVLSHDQLFEYGKRTERTSAMCRRVKCLAAVNGDFFAAGVPVGGVVAAGEVLRSPPGSRAQASFSEDGTATMGELHVTGRLITTRVVPPQVTDPAMDAVHPRVPPTDSTPFGGVNVSRHADQIVLYTAAFGPKTLTNGSGVELVVKMSQKGPIRSGVDVPVELVAKRRGNTKISSDVAILSGHGDGAKALEQIWKEVDAGARSSDAIVRVDSDPHAAMSIAGNPVILRNGKNAFSNHGIARGHNPRTVLGWSPDGHVFLVTFDGRQGRRALGMTLTEVASFLRAIGITDALNLDGGGSTTFVGGGKVYNRPSDRLVRRHGRLRIVHSPRRGDRFIRYLERPVAEALTIVRSGS
ncbi:MAG: phosphodiester glycosidase family protein [Actinobacteria bacterium]|nr:phosphodiester glycosidase family protein [Actinomycetota bacterium]